MDDRTDNHYGLLCSRRHLSLLWHLWFPGWFSVRGRQDGECRFWFGCLWCHSCGCGYNGFDDWNRGALFPQQPVYRHAEAGVWGEGWNAQRQGENPEKGIVGRLEKWAVQHDADHSGRDRIELYGYQDCDGKYQCRENHVKRLWRADKYGELHLQKVQLWRGGHWHEHGRDYNKRHLSRGGWGRQWYGCNQGWRLYLSEFGCR